MLTDPDVLPTWRGRDGSLLAEDGSKEEARAPFKEAVAAGPGVQPADDHAQHRRSNSAAAAAAAAAGAPAHAHADAPATAAAAAAPAPGKRFRRSSGTAVTRSGGTVRRHVRPRSRRAGRLGGCVWRFGGI